MPSSLVVELYSPDPSRAIERQSGQLSCRPPRQAYQIQMSCRQTRTCPACRSRHQQTEALTAMRIGNVVFLRCMQALELELLPGNGRRPGEVRRPERDGMPMLTVLPMSKMRAIGEAGKVQLQKLARSQLPTPMQNRGRETPVCVSPTPEHGSPCHDCLEEPDTRLRQSVKTATKSRDICNTRWAR